MASPSLEQIEGLTRKVVEAEGLELVDLEYKQGRPRNFLRITIDKPGGVTLGDCENVSNQLGTLLDVNDLVSDAYVLEVSSPGLDRPFRTDRDYERARNHYVRLVVTEEEGRHDVVLGTLKEFDDQHVVVDQEGKFRTIDRGRIKRAQQEVKISSPPKRSRKRR